MDAELLTDAAAFLDAAGPYLAANPLSCSVVATVAERRSHLAPSHDAPCWFALLRDGGEVVGVAMRTHPEPPHPGFVVAMPGTAVDALAAELHRRGEVVPAWNGDLDAASRLCAAVGRPEIVTHTRLFEATQVIAPRRPAGELRAATPDDLPLVLAWKAAFHHDAELQGGRDPGPGRRPDEATTRADVERGGVWLWTVDGEPRHLAAVQEPLLGVVRIGPVYTPAEHRGHGYAGWVVATLTQRILDAGQRACLYTDQANPVSNAVYERIGYRRVHDEAHVVAR